MRTRRSHSGAARPWCSRVRVLIRGSRSAGDWRLLAGVGFLQIITALAVRATPWSTLGRTAARLRTLAALVPCGGEERVIWAIEATGTRLPRVSTCLVRAIVAEVLLASPGRPVHVTIGVTRPTSGVFEAHAWAERDGRALVGGPISGVYTPLATWENRIL